MGKLMGLYQSPKTRMKAVVLTITVIVVAAVFFLINENYANRSAYRNVYSQRQQEYTDQLANQLSFLVETETQDQEIVTYFAEHAEVSGSSWSFVCRGDEVIFAKDQITTENLGLTSQKDKFLEELEEQNLIQTLSEQTIQGTLYLTGTVTDEYYAFTRGAIMQHEIYGYLVVGILVMLGVMAVIGVTERLNREQRERQTLSDTLQQQNQKLETTEKKLIDQPVEDEYAAAQAVAGGKDDYYDSEWIELFLRKSDDARLRPLQVLFFRMEMEERYYSKQEIFEVVDGMKELLGSSHVIGEVAKGSFVVLMYRTSAEEAETMMQKFHARWGRKVRFDMRTVEVKENERAVDVYVKNLDKKRAF